MKKIGIITGLICVIAVAAAYAGGEAPEAAVKEYTMRTDNAPTMTGTVETVLPSNYARPTAKLILNDDKGAGVTFTVSPTAAIYQAVGGALVSVTSLTNGDRVEVSYREWRDGTYRANAIKILPRVGAAVSAPTPAPVPEPVPPAAIPAAEPQEK